MQGLVHVNFLFVLDHLVFVKFCIVTATSIAVNLYTHIILNMFYTSIIAFKEVNKIIDSLANLDCKVVNEIQVYDQSPTCVKQLVDVDLLRICTRLVSL
jgi:pyoverdine/dityrosine biosynthesis protein Dit1